MLSDQQGTYPPVLFSLRLRLQAIYVHQQCYRASLSQTAHYSERRCTRSDFFADVYKNDKELVQSAIDYALAEIKNKRLDSEIKLEFERIKLAQLQKQLELANIQKNLPQNSDIRNPSVFETADNNNVETLLKSVKTLTIPVPSRVESYNLFFQSLEKAFKIKEFPEQFKCEILLNILENRLRESEHESPKIYELSTVTYGTVSAPYLAQRTLTQLSMDEEANFPIAASVLRNNLYMDDVLCGSATLEEAIVLRQQLKGILKGAGMELYKLCANHEKLSPDPEQNYNFATLTETKTDVLSTIAKTFDPVGLMAPVISKAKIFLQRLWRSKLEWNDLLPAEEYREWQQFLVSLENINNIEIPRRILVSFPEVIEIHGFADTSERCYGAAVYCKSKNLKSENLVRLITSKSRVAPIKSLTIPRLELCAAVLLAKLVKRVVAALQLETAEVYLWSDSMIVLAWLRKEPMDLKTFVQNRVAKIQELYPNQLWRHVPSDQNPADLFSRGVDPEKLLQQNLWFNGPTFLSGDDYPNRTINCREKLDEYNSELKTVLMNKLKTFNRFVENLKGINKVAGPLTTKEFVKAETYLIKKKVQEQEFSSDINHLKSKGSVLPNITMIAWLNQCNVGRYVSSVIEQRPLAACKEKRSVSVTPHSERLCTE
ncbi:uncharacterized protein TNCV_2043241 [Trichonephila clavipes]|nr:uncharacterized protein TNCV_2043241 [Trichonephila clavipes]